MVNQVLHGYVRQVRHRLRHLPRAVQREVMAELLAHIEDDTALRQRSNPALARQQASAEAIEAFCPADDIGVAIGPRGGIIRSSSGELLLPVAVLSGEGLGRHARMTQAWTAVAAAGSAALVAAVAFGAFLASQGDDGALDWDSHSLDAGAATAILLDQQWSAVDGFGNTTVSVPDWARGRAMTLAAHGTGCVAARLYDPAGAVAVDAWDPSGRADCGSVRGTTGSVQPGVWLLQLYFEAYSGYVRMDAGDGSAP